MFKGTEALGLMQSRAGVTAESLVELKEALKAVTNENANGDPYTAEEVEVNAHTDSPSLWGLVRLWPHSVVWRIPPSIVLSREHRCGGQCRLREDTWIGFHRVPVCMRMRRGR